MADKVKVRVILPGVLASVGGPDYAEGTVEIAADVAKAAEALGAIERTTKRAAAGAKPAAKSTRKSTRKRSSSPRVSKTPGSTAAAGTSSESSAG